MKKLVLLLAFLPGCCTTPEPPTENFYTVLQPVLNEYLQYVNADPNLTQSERALRVAEVDTLAGYILEARREP